MGTELAIIVGCILAGMILIFFELIIPSFGVLTAMAVAVLGVAVWRGFEVSAVAGILTLAVLMFGIPAYLVALIRYLPRTNVGRKLFLQRVTGTADTAAPKAEELATLVGRVGTADTVLRPSGKIRIDGRRFHATAESGMIAKGADVKVVRSVGVNVVVRPTISDLDAPQGEADASSST